MPLGAIFGLFVLPRCWLHLSASWQSASRVDSSRLRARHARSDGGHEPDGHLTDGGPGVPEEANADVARNERSCKDRSEKERWTVLKEQRWLPPKGLNGRRWYMDSANSAVLPDEQDDEARIEMNRNHASPGAGRIKGGAATLLRQYTNLDRPDKNGVVPRDLPFQEADFANNPDKALDVPTDTIDYESMRRVQTLSDNEVAATGLSRDLLRWVYSLPRPTLRKELYKRQLQREVRLAGDVRDLRESLMKDLRMERSYSPTRMVFPGTAAVLSGGQLQQEIEANSDVPILLAVVSRNTVQGVKCHKELQRVASRLLRSVRVIQLEGSQYPEVVRERKVRRYPTFIWLEPRTGREMRRVLGVTAASSLFDQTRVMLQTPQLPVSRQPP